MLPFFPMVSNILQQELRNKEKYWNKASIGTKWVTHVYSIPE